MLSVFERNERLSLQTFLKSRNVNFDVINQYDLSHESVPREHLAKPLLLKNQFNQYVMALLPSDRTFLQNALSDFKYCDYDLLDERAIDSLLLAGEQGVRPSITADISIELLVDPELLLGDEVYVESGDHASVLKLSMKDFKYLLQGARRVTLGGELINSYRQVEADLAHTYEAVAYQ